MIKFAFEVALICGVAVSQGRLKSEAEIERFKMIVGRWKKDQDVAPGGAV